jgi:hypothetical protein
VEYLVANTANQTLYLSLNEARTFLDTYTHYLMILTRQQTGEDFALVLDVVIENDRYTQVTISTNADDGENSSIELLESGTYEYYIYGQNSSTNLNPLNIAVKGITHRGRIIVPDTATYINTPTVTLPDNVTA